MWFPGDGIGPVVPDVAEAAGVSGAGRAQNHGHDLHRSARRVVQRDGKPRMVEDLGGSHQRRRIDHERRSRGIEANADRPVLAVGAAGQRRELCLDLCRAGCIAGRGQVAAQGFERDRGRRDSPRARAGRSARPARALPSARTPGRCRARQRLPAACRTRWRDRRTRGTRPDAPACDGSRARRPPGAQPPRSGAGRRERGNSCRRAPRPAGTRSALRPSLRAPRRPARAARRRAATGRRRGSCRCRMPPGRRRRDCSSSGAGSCRPCRRTGSSRSRPGRRARGRVRAPSSTGTKPGAGRSDVTTARSPCSITRQGFEATSLRARSSSS